LSSGAQKDSRVTFRFARILQNKDIVQPVSLYKTTGVCPVGFEGSESRHYSRHTYHTSTPCRHQIRGTPHAGPHSVPPHQTPHRLRPSSRRAITFDLPSKRSAPSMRLPRTQRLPPTQLLRRLVLHRRRLGRQSPIRGLIKPRAKTMPQKSHQCGGQGDRATEVYRACAPSASCRWRRKR
jgi:hypothetical protein